MTDQPDAGSEPIEIIAPDALSWEFIGRAPTSDEVRTLLLTLPEWWGVRAVDFIDYVQPLPQKKKVDVMKPGPSGKMFPAKEDVEVYSLYFSVAGRQQMARAAAELNSWKVDFVPEPNVPEGCPAGFLEFGERLVYREYCEIAQLVDEGEPVSLGRKPGTAWVPRSKEGRTAKSTNPYEKCETAARGRALGAWGFGVLPGSGVASLEEMLGVSANRDAIAAEVQSDGGHVHGRGEAQPEVNRDAVLEDLLTTITRIQQITGRDDYQTNAITAKWFLEKTGIDIIGERDPETKEILVLEWSRVKKTGQLVLARDLFRKSLQTLQADVEGV